MTSSRVEISKSVLALLVGGLLLTLVLLAFLLGRESARPVAVATSAVVAGAPLEYRGEIASGPESSGELERLERPPSGLPTHYRAGPQTGIAGPPVAGAGAASQDSAVPGQSSSKAYPNAAAGTASSPRSTTSARTASAPAAPPAAPASRVDPQDVDSTRKYLAEIDRTLAATPSLSDPNSFATQLLGQSISGDTSGFDILLTEARGSLSRLSDIQPPAHCQEHHTLHVRQLQKGIALLAKVKDATQGVDTAALSQLSLQGHAMQAEIMRLQQIDQQLRDSIR